MSTPSNTMNLPLLAISTVVKGCSQTNLPTDLTRYNVPADGSCLYHCIAQLYNHYNQPEANKEMREVRSELKNWILKNIEQFNDMYFKHEGKILTYGDLTVKLEKVEGCGWGGLLETEAIAEMYDVDINFWDALNGTTPKLLFVLMSSKTRPDPPRKPWNLIRQEDHFNYALEGFVHYSQQEPKLTAMERAALLRRIRQRAKFPPSTLDVYSDQLAERAQRLKERGNPANGSMCDMTGGGACDSQSMKRIDETPNLGENVVEALNEKMTRFQEMMLQQVTENSTGFTARYMEQSYIRNRAREAMINQKNKVVSEILERLRSDATKEQRDALENLYDQEVESTIAKLLLTLFSNE